jgi:hypothetical protein
MGDTSKTCGRFFFSPHLAVNATERSLLTMIMLHMSRHASFSGVRCVGTEKRHNSLRASCILKSSEQLGRSLKRGV